MSDRLFVATRKGLFTVARGAAKPATWAIARADFLGDNVSMALEDPRSGHILAALDLGHFGVKLRRSTDAGASWEECAAPAYPPKPEDDASVDMWGKPIPWTTVKIWALEPGGADEPGVFWCGTIPGGLFRSGDGGLTWDFARSLWDDPKRKQWVGGGADLPGIHSVCVDPRDAKRVLIGVSIGGVWMTADGGATWAPHGTGMRAAYMPPELMYEPNAQDAHRLAWCAAAPDRLWIQHHNGIFRSIDGGLRWEEVMEAGPSTSGFAVVSHPKAPDTAWFIPMISDERRLPPDGKLVVTRTRDGGKTFETLSAGLPQEHAYDLVYRHGLDIDATGNRLAFGTTTGSLFISEDGGESWMCTARHLPPVYAVRFGGR